MGNIRYSVIVPAYNESTVIESSLKKLIEQLATDGLTETTEIIVVSADGDNTAELAENFIKTYPALKVLRPGPKVGKGRDVQFGIKQAVGEFVIFTDADMATPPHHIKPMLEKLEAEYDVVIGVRKLNNIHNSMSRRLRSLISNMMIRTLAVPGVSDTQCGFKGFKVEPAKQLFDHLDSLGWGFDFEILAKARARKYKIYQMEINDWFDPKEDVMGLAGESDWQANIRTLKELKKIFINRIKGVYRA